MTKISAEEARAEILGKRLLKYYGMTWRKCRSNGSTGRRLIRIKLKGPGIYWDFYESFAVRTWYEFLFGRGCDGSLSVNDTFNHYVYSMSEGGFPSYKKVKAKLLCFKTLDELDVLLTLAGANSVSKTEAV